LKSQHEPHALQLLAIKIPIPVFERFEHIDRRKRHRLACIPAAVLTRFIKGM
jgi:hypothetical protein